jgi:hypothetical protein
MSNDDGDLVIYDRVTRKGFNYSKSSWPHELPVNYDTISRVVEELGKSRNRRGKFPRLSTGSIRSLF